MQIQAEIQRTEPIKNSYIRIGILSIKTPSEQYEKTQYIAVSVISKKVEDTCQRLQSPSDEFYHNIHSVMLTFSGNKNPPALVTEGIILFIRSKSDWLITCLSLSLIN